MIFQERSNGSLQFVGDFERLYETDEDPWGQSGSGDRAPYYRWSRDHLTKRLNNYLGARVEGLEIGCGHGHVVAKLAEECGGRWAGLDISKAALQRAVEIQPRGIEFLHGDISQSSFYLIRPCNVIIWSQMLWYVADPLEKLQQAMRNTMWLLEPGGLFVIHQALLPPGGQRYALETINGFQGALKQFMSYEALELIEARYRPDALAGLHDGLIIMRKKVASSNEDNSTQ